ncbi:MATE family efflux transporter [Sorangium cellulosum]|uniref:MATE family efflux transporter n=1 Tax=Sorangium cellulosum TaxID=56 RepID=A0A150Q5W3_SORCE|nr:MATE family efflux transporter [Sorangium cellulosum]KYF63362.1 MATE family efflux transporter [Sorangium cellulosum]
MKPRFGTDLTTGSIPRHLVTFSLPMLLGGFLQTTYSFINAIWVGQFLGTGALAAVTVSFPVIFTIFGVGMGMTLATNILVSQSFGARRFDELRRVVDGSTALIYGLGVLLTLVGEIFTPEILRAMDTPADVFAPSVSYLRIVLLSLPFSFGMFALRSMLQGTGDSKTPLYFQLGSVLLTTVLDPLLIFGRLGLPELGLNGTAWATIVSQVISLVALHVYLHVKKSPIAPRWPRFGQLGPTIRKTCRIGVPASIQQSVVSLGMVVVTGIVNGFGEVATAAFGAASRIDQIAFLPAINMGMAISTLAGQNLGAGHHGRVREVFTWGCVFSGGITLVISAAALIFPEALLRVFIADPVVVDLGVSYLHIVGACYVLFGLSFVSNGIINGAGATVVTTVISLLSLWVIRAPLAYWLSREMRSVEGVWYAIAVSFVVSLIASLSYYASGRWKRALVQKAPAADPTREADPARAFANEVGEA